MNANDLYRLGTVVFNGVEVEEVQQNELLYIKPMPSFAVNSFKK